MLLYIVRSYFNEELDFGSFKVRANTFAEVPGDIMKDLAPEHKAHLIKSRDLRRVSIQMVDDGKPVAQFNERAVLQKHGE